MITYAITEEAAGGPMSQNMKTIIVPSVTTTSCNQTSIKAFAAAGRLFITREFSGKCPRTTSMRRLNSTEPQSEIAGGGGRSAVHTYFQIKCF